MALCIWYCDTYTLVQSNFILQGVRFYVLSGKHSTAAALRILQAALELPEHPRYPALADRVRERAVTCWALDGLGPGDIYAIIGNNIATQEIVACMQSEKLVAYL